MTDEVLYCEEKGCEGTVTIEEYDRQIRWRVDRDHPMFGSGGLPT